MVLHARFLQNEPEKRTKLPRLVLAPARTAVKILLRKNTGKFKSNPLEPHFPTSATMSRCLERTKTAVALPHCGESLWQSDGTSYKKNTLLPVVDLCKKSVKRHFFFGGATQVNYPISRHRDRYAPPPRPLAPTHGVP